MKLKTLEQFGQKDPCECGGNCGCGNGNKSVNEGISVSDERPFGKKGIIIMIDDNGKKVSAIFKDKKNADKFNRNKPSDIKKLLQLAKKTKYPKAIDESVNEKFSFSKKEVEAAANSNSICNFSS